MMLSFIEISTIQAFLLGIPESVGLLAFGIGLVTAAVVVRWLLGRNEAAKAEERLDEEPTR